VRPVVSRTPLRKALDRRDSLRCAVQTGQPMGREDAVAPALGERDVAGVVEEDPGALALGLLRPPVTPDRGDREAGEDLLVDRALDPPPFRRSIPPVSTLHSFAINGGSLPGSTSRQTSDLRLRLTSSTAWGVAAPGRTRCQARTAG
jgi:hypothetical protein